MSPRDMDERELDAVHGGRDRQDVPTARKDDTHIRLAVMYGDGERSTFEDPRGDGDPRGILLAVVLGIAAWVALSLGIAWALGLVI